MLLKSEDALVESRSVLDLKIFIYNQISADAGTAGQQTHNRYCKALRCLSLTAAVMANFHINNTEQYSKMCLVTLFKRLQINY